LYLHLRSCSERLSGGHIQWLLSFNSSAGSLLGGNYLLVVGPGLSVGWLVSGQAGGDVVDGPLEGVVDGLVVVVGVVGLGPRLPGLLGQAIGALVVRVGPTGTVVEDLVVAEGELLLDFLGVGAQAVYAGRGGDRGAELVGLLLVLE